ncbi:MAG: SEC-C metal-binding domain-containing protein [Actinomycetota bacterium]
MLAEEILRSCLEIEEEVLTLALERGERLIPIAIAMCADLLAEIEPDLLPDGFVFLLRLIGCHKPRQALPVLMLALEGCCGEELHETVLALAKLGSLYPDEVSAGLRRVAGDPAYGEARLAAVEALGLLGREAGNGGFLREMLLGLDPEDPFYNDMFIFIVQALVSSGGEEVGEVIGAALSEHHSFLDEAAAAFARESLAGRDSTGLGCRLEGFVDEDMADLREFELDFEIDRLRSTMTREREEDLELIPEEDEEWLPDLGWVEEQLRTGRNDPCPCGSGSKFKKCCLPRLEELRDILLYGGFDEGEPWLGALLMSSLADFAREHSKAAERKAARDEYLGSLGRTRFGEGGTEGVEILEEALFNDWFLIRWPLGESGRTVAEEFAAAHGSDLKDEQARLLRGLVSARFSVYEIESMDDGGTSLRDVFRNERYRVSGDFLGPDTAEGDLVGGFLGDTGGRHELLSNVIYAPGDFLGELERFVSVESGKAIERGEAGDLDEFLQRSGYRVLYEMMRLYGIHSL